MSKRIVLLPGEICSGKSTLGRSLEATEGADVFRTREVLQRRVTPEFEHDRKALQAEGDRLDRETDHRWVLDEFKSWRAKIDRPETLVVDSVRTPGQVASFREGFGPAITHVHLTAPVDQLEERCINRKQAGAKAYPFSEVRANPIEQQFEGLSKIADLVVNPFRRTEVDVLTRANSHLGVTHSAGRGFVAVMVGGQYGSEGKGQIVDHPSGEQDLLIRVGEPTAGHSVFREPAPYIHHHLHSGAQSTKARLLIGPGAVLRIPNLLQESNHSPFRTA